MNIASFAKKPTLVKITIDDEEIVKEYGDVFFYVFDQVDLNTYFDFFKSQQDQDGSALNSLLRKLILNDKGQPAMKEQDLLPIDLTVAAIRAIGDQLGKSGTKQSTQTTGEQQS